MLQRNLLYTGVSRGKRLVVLVEQKNSCHRDAKRIGTAALVKTQRMVDRACVIPAVRPLLDPNPIGCVPDYRTVFER
jgi:hypothetical protein